MSTPHGGVDIVNDISRRVMHWVRFLGPGRIAGGAAAIGVSLVVAAVLFFPSAPPQELALPLSSAVPAHGVSTTAAGRPSVVVRVHVAGAVRAPGVYTLRSSDRVVDAVAAAGGPAANADLDSINLAQTILDTEQIYVPKKSVQQSRTRKPAPRLVPRRSPSAGVPATTVATGSTTTMPGASMVTKVNINSATATQLDTLPGIGPTTARAIISYRQSKGPYSRVEDLLNVPGIGPAKLDAMRAMIET